MHLALNARMMLMSWNRVDLQVCLCSCCSISSEGLIRKSVFFEAELALYGKTIAKRTDEFRCRFEMMPVLGNLLYGSMRVFANDETVFHYFSFDPVGASYISAGQELRSSQPAGTMVGDGFNTSAHVRLIR